MTKSKSRKSKIKRKRNVSKRKQVGGQINVNIGGSEQSFNSIPELYTRLFSSAQAVSKCPLLILNQQVQISFLPCYKFTGIIENDSNPNNGLSGICFLEKNFQTNNYQDCVRLIYSQNQNIIDTNSNKSLLENIYPQNLTIIENLVTDEDLKDLSSKRRDRITNQQLKIISLEDENKRLKQEIQAFDRDNECKAECQSELKQESQECEQQEQSKLEQEELEYIDNTDKMRRLVSIEKKNNNNENLFRSQTQERKKRELEERLKKRLKKRKQAKPERENISAISQKNASFP